MDIPRDRALFDVGGTAASTRIATYRPNTGELTDRSVEGLLAWAESKGIRAPSFATIIPFDSQTPLLRRGRPVDAKYFEATYVPEDAYIYWDEPQEPRLSLVDRSFRRVVINVSHEVMQNDERLLHVLAHEVFELTELEQLFVASAGRMPIARFYELVEPLSTAKNLHWNAWEQADSFIERLRRENA